MSAHVKHLLLDSIHGELAPAEAERVSRHLSECARCRRLHAKMASAAERLRELPREPAPPGLWNAVARRVASQRPMGTSRPFARPLAIGTAAAAMLLAGGLIWLALEAGRGGWEVERTSGMPLLGARPLGSRGTLRVGQWLSTDASSGARISSALVGEIEVGPGTRLVLLASRSREQQFAPTGLSKSGMWLAEGSLEARIWAPPRVFFVQTPSATAVDLGCQYRMRIDSAGNGRLHVTMGWVELERAGRAVIVPVGAMCEIRTGRGPGTPFSQSASPAFRSALDRYDLEGSDDALATVLREAKAGDAVTLWHLLQHGGAASRAATFDRLASLVPPPPTVTRAGILAGNPQMLDAWWDAFGPEESSWLRFWRERHARNESPRP
jgi:Putative zinc-finger